MARYGSSQVAFLLVDGYSILGQTTELDVKEETKIEPVDALGDSWAAYAVAGPHGWTVTQKGIFDDTSGAIHDALVAGYGQSRVLCLGLAGNAAGRPFSGAAAPVQASYDRMIERGALHKAAAEIKGSGRLDEGRILAPLADRTAAGDTKPGVDEGGATAAGGAAYLQVPALSLGGYTSVGVSVVHSADAVTWVELGAFAAVTAAPSAQRITFSGTIQRYVAVVWTWAGTGSGQSARFMTGLVRY